MRSRNPDPNSIAKALDHPQQKLGDSSTVQPLMAYTRDAAAQRVPVEHNGPAVATLATRKMKMPENLAMPIDTTQKSQQLMILNLLR